MMYDSKNKQMLKNVSLIPDNKAVWFGYAGKPRSAQGWPTGTYRAEYRLERKGATVTSTKYELKIS